MIPSAMGSSMGFRKDGLRQEPCPPCPSGKKEVSMHQEARKRKKKLLYKVVMIVSIFSLLAGLLGCGGSGQGTSSEVQQIVSFSATSQSSMSITPTYAFALRKKDGEWFFSADCYVDSPQSHYTSFNSFPIPAEDVKGLLKIIDEEQELKRLRKYREPLLTRLFGSSLLDGGWDYTRVAFTDLEPLERETLPCDKVRDYLRDLAEKHCQAAESVEIVAVSVSRESPDPSIACSFTLKKELYRYGDSLSFSAVLDPADGLEEEEELVIGTKDTEAVIHIIKEQQLIEKVKQYEPPAEGDGTADPDETVCQLSFQFADGSQISAPIDPGAKLMALFYSIAAANK